METSQSTVDNEFSFFSFPIHTEFHSAIHPIRTKSLSQSDHGTHFYGDGSDSPAYGLILAAGRTCTDLELDGENQLLHKSTVPMERRASVMELEPDVTFPYLREGGSLEEDVAHILKKWRKTTDRLEHQRLRDEENCLKKILEVVQAHKDRLLSQRQPILETRVALSPRDSGKKKVQESARVDKHVSKPRDSRASCSTSDSAASTSFSSANSEKVNEGPQGTGGSSGRPRPKTSSFWRAGPNPGPKRSPLPETPKDSQVQPAVLEKLKRARNPSSSL